MVFVCLFSGCADICAPMEYVREFGSILKVGMEVRLLLEVRACRVLLRGSGAKALNSKFGLF